MNCNLEAFNVCPDKRFCSPGQAFPSDCWCGGFNDGVQAALKAQLQPDPGSVDALLYAIRELAESDVLRDALRKVVESHGDD